MPRHRIGRWLLVVAGTCVVSAVGLFFAPGLLTDHVEGKTLARWFGDDMFGSGKGPAFASMVLWGHFKPWAVGLLVTGLLLTMAGGVLSFRATGPRS